MPDRLGQSGCRVTLVATGVVLLLATVPAAGSEAPMSGQEKSTVEGVSPWRAIFQGVDYTSLRAERPRPLQGHALRIDLRAPGIGFVATPGNGNRPEETDGLTTSAFLENQRCQGAINAAPFHPIHILPGRPQDVYGLMISGGQLVSPAEEPYPALLITRDRQARIEAFPPNTNNVDVAVAGFHIVLKAGRNLGVDGPIHPRTAAGISAEGRYLYLLVVDGRQAGYSEGATTRELASWLHKLGAVDGINLDGGGTTTMVLQGHDGRPQVVNRPIHGGIAGLQRVSGSHLGFRAHPLSSK